MNLSPLLLGGPAEAPGIAEGLNRAAAPVQNGTVPGVGAELSCSLVAIKPNGIKAALNQLLQIILQPGLCTPGVGRPQPATPCGFAPDGVALDQLKHQIGAGF